MKLNNIIESSVAPDKTNLWLYKGVLKYFGPNGWTPTNTKDTLSNGSYLVENVDAIIEINPTPINGNTYKITNPQFEIDTIIDKATASPTQYNFNANFGGVVLEFTIIEYGGTGQITAKTIIDDGNYVLRLYDSSNNKESILNYYPEGAIVSRHTRSEIELYKRKFNAEYNKDEDIFNVLLGATIYNMSGADCAEMLIEFSKALINNDLTNLYANSTSPYIKTGLITNTIGSLQLSNTFANNSHLKVVYLNSNTGNIAVLSMLNTFSNCTSLESISGIIDATDCSSFNKAFSNCFKLHSVKITHLKTNLDLSSSPYITAESLDYLVTNASNTSEITITLEKSVLAKINGAEPQWAAVKSKANNKNIIFN